jgi:hypothetical protein
VAGAATVGNVCVVSQRPAERPHATAVQVNEIASRIDRFSGQVLVVTAVRPAARETSVWAVGRGSGGSRVRRTTPVVSTSDVEASDG